MGRALLEGRGEAVGVLARAPFYTSTELVEPKYALGGAALLEKAFGDKVERVDVALSSPRSSTAGGRDLLHKVARMRSTPKDAREGDPVFQRAEEIGLVAMLRSASYERLVEVLCGHPVTGPVMMQALCFGPGDYAGPHTDHHPEYEETRRGYTDVHFTFCSPGVHRQLLVYATGGHFSKVVDIAKSGTVTAYRLPVWHYTTPLEATPEARRWLVLNTFIHPGHGWVSD